MYEMLDQVSLNSSMTPNDAKSVFDQFEFLNGSERVIKAGQSLYNSLEDACKTIDVLRKEIAALNPPVEETEKPVKKRKASAKLVKP